MDDSEAGAGEAHVETVVRRCVRFEGGQGWEDVGGGEHQAACCGMSAILRSRA